MLKELTGKKKEEFSTFESDVIRIINDIQKKESDYKAAVNKFSLDIREYINKNSHLFKQDYVMEALAKEYTSFLEWYYIDTPKKDYKGDLKKLIELFNKDEDKATIIHYLFIHSYIEINDNLAEEASNLLTTDYKYLVDNNTMRLIDVHTIYRLVYDNFRNLDSMIIYDYMDNIKFYRSEKSIKNTLILMSLIGSGKLNVDYKLLGGKPPYFNKASSIYHYIKQDGRFLISARYYNREAYLKIYFVYNNNVYSIKDMLNNNSKKGLHSLNQLKPIEFYQFIESIEFDVLSNEVKYLILDDYFFNKKVSAKFLNSAFNNLDEKISEVKDESMTIFAIHYINRKGVQLLDSFSFPDNIMLDIYIKSNKHKDDIKEYIEKNNTDLIADINVIEEILNS